MFDLIREILQTLRNNKLRTSLTGFSVAWGIFMLIVLLGVSRGVYNSFNEDVAANGAKINIYQGYTSLPYKGLKENRFIKLRKEDMTALARENSKYIGDVSSEINLSGTVSTTKDYISSTTKGVYPDYVSWTKMYKGRFINNRDLQDRRKVIILTKANAELLFDNADDAIGKQIKYNNLAFTVIGLSNDQGRTSSLIPFTTAMQLNGNDNKISSIALSTKNLETVEQAKALETNIRESLGRRHTFDPNDRSAVWVWNQFVQQMDALGGLKALNIAIWIIGILTMLSGIVGVSNIMFVSVRERTHEIGIRRAIGAKPRNILTQIIFESISITALFGYVGIFFGICVSELISTIFADSQFMKNPTVDISIAISVTIVLIIAGCLAGMFPAMKALKIKPVEALRTE